MQEPPDLSDETIIRAVQTHYSISVAGLTFLPIGFDSGAWAYRIEAADGTICFLKIRKSIANEAGLTVPHVLRERGISQVVAPLPTIVEALWAPAGDFALIMYPFIDGRTGTDVGLSRSQWTAFGTMIKQIHSMTVRSELLDMVRRDTFAPEWRSMVERVDAQITARSFTDPFQQELALFWLGRRQEIRRLVSRTTSLGQRLQASTPPLVLCHADLHTWSVLIDEAQQLWLVDWDETVVAAKERDLMFLVDGIGPDLVRPEEEKWFFEGYGVSSIDPLALAYYRYAWAIGDIGSFGETVFMMPEVGAVTRSDAARRLISLFQPGYIVHLAYAADNSLLGSYHT